jgi:hypothetical protein
MAADICPSAASLPACTNSFCVVRSLDLGLQRRIRCAELAGAFGHLAFEPAGGFALRDIGAVPLHHIK